MTDLAVDPITDDLLLVSGAAQLAVGPAAVAQAWKTHLTLFVGECFRDRSLGIDYQNLILIKNPAWAVIRGLFARASRETPGVQELKDITFRFDPRTRLLQVDASVITTDGTELQLGLEQAIGD